MDRKRQAHDSSYIYQVGVSLLQDSVSLIENHVKTDNSYTKESLLLPGSTIGRHIRHIYEYFRILMSSQDHVDYDMRQRNVPMETSRQFALSALKHLQSEILPKKINLNIKPTTIPLDHKMTLSTTISTEYEVEVEEETSEGLSTYATFQTSLGRELWFCCCHAIHHMAIIRAICSEQGIKLEDDFGFAPSTLDMQKWYRRMSENPNNVPNVKSRL